MWRASNSAPTTTRCAGNSTRRSRPPAIATANGTGTYEEYSEKVRDLEKQNPISMRHIMGLKGDRPAVDPSGVDAGVGHHDYPIVISSMSFGSQSEPAFRAYADAGWQVTDHYELG